MIDERALFERAALRFDPPADAFGRLIERQVRRERVRRAAVVAAALLVAGTALIGVIAQFRSGERHTPATPSFVPAAPEGFRSSLLPFASLAYPDRWWLLDTSGADQGDEGPVLQLTNFDAGLRPVDCSAGSFPAGGVALVIAEAGAAASDTPAWPVALSPAAGPDATACPGRLEATWRTRAGIAYRADAYVGEAASTADVRALSRAFGTLMTPSPGWPRMAATGTGPRVVLDSGLNGADPVSLYAYTSGKHVWLGVMGPVDSANPGTPSIYGSAYGIDTGSPSSDAVDLGVDGADTPYAVAYGTADPRVAQVDIVSGYGDRHPGILVDFPASLGRAEGAVWAFLPGPTGAFVLGVGYDAQGEPVGPVPAVPTALPNTIATGLDPTFGRWSLSITHSSDGDGLDLSWPDLGSSGGPCCFDRFDRPASDRIVPIESGGPDPSTILALVSPDAVRVEFATASEWIPGRLVALPDRYLGPASVAVVVVPDELGDGAGDLLGTLIASDADGNTLASAFLGGGVADLSPPSAGAAAVWESLARARNAVLAYLGDHAIADATAEVLGPLDPHVRWAAQRGAPGVSLSIEPSVDGSRGDVLLTSRTASGRPYCVAIQVGGDGRMTFHYGAAEPSTAAVCVGGWT